MSTDSPTNAQNAWFIFGRDPGAEAPELPPPPRWRDFSDRHHEDAQTKTKRRGSTFQPGEEEKKMVNADLYIRRPLLVKGKPGTGKTSLAYAVAYQLGLGEVLYWTVTTRTTLKDGLYSYDAIGRIQDFQMQKGDDRQDNIGDYIRLGPLGTAFYPFEGQTIQKPKVLLIDEIDKSDIDLPNDLLHIFEEGEFGIPELERLKSKQPNGCSVYTAFKDPAGDDFKNHQTVNIPDGRVRCKVFPFVILTSNGEREFPPAFLRRCLRLDIGSPSLERLERIVETQLGDKAWVDVAKELIQGFHDSVDQKGVFLSTDQLLNAVELISKHKAPASLKADLLRPLDR